MLTRELLDEILPDSELLDAAVSRCLKECFKVEEASHSAASVVWILQLMAEALERDFASWNDKEEWHKPGDPEFSRDWPYSISFRGLQYKSYSNYLTAEGWPTGTKCWYVTVEYGWREHVTALDPYTAVKRAVVVMCAAFRTKKTRPSSRRELVDVMRTIMSE